MEEVKQLIKVLKKQLHLYDKLCEFCTREKQAIMEGRLKELEVAVQKEEEILAQIKIWEKLRAEMIKSLKEQFSLSEDASFVRILENLQDSPDFSELNSLRGKIISRIKNINQINRKNISLLEYSVRLIDDYFSKLTGAKTSSTYNLQGKTQKKEQTRKLLNGTG